MTDNVFCGKCSLFHKYHPEGCPECHVIPGLRADNNRLKEALKPFAKMYYVDD